MQMNLLDAVAEQTALDSISQSDKLSGPTCPKIICTHMPQPDLDPAADPRGPDTCLPWTVMTACHGKAFGSLEETPASLAAAVGSALATLHSLPPPDAGLELSLPPRTDRNGAEAGQMGGWWFKDEDAWRDSIIRKGQILSSPNPWEPFIAFLRRSRQEIWRRCFADAALPLPLVQELDSYLPKVTKALKHFVTA